MKNILLIGFLSSFLLSYGTTELGAVSYFPLVMCALLILFLCLVKLSKGYPVGIKIKMNQKEFSPFDRLLSSSLFWLWYLIVFSWIYGISIGLINNIYPNFVFRNFFGLLTYMIFPVILITLPSIRSIIIMIYLAGIVQILVGIAKTYALITNPVAFYIRNSLTELRSFYSVGFLLIFPLFVIGISRYFLPKNVFLQKYGKMVFILSNSLIFTFFATYSLIVPAMSKGFILSAALLFFGIISVSYIYFFKSGKIKKNTVIFSCFLILVMMLLPYSFYEVIFTSYSTKDLGNSIRAEQFHYLMEDLTFWGHGLGASLSSGYARGATSYAFELTYLNIIHKLGVFSVFIFSSYIITLVLAFNRILRKVYVFESLIALGLMGYLVVGIGNPLLLSPIAVSIHCLAMYILIKPFIAPFKKSPYGVQQHAQTASINTKIGNIIN